MPHPSIAPLLAAPKQPPRSTSNASSRSTVNQPEKAKRPCRSIAKIMVPTVLLTAMGMTLIRAVVLCQILFDCGTKARKGSEPGTYHKSAANLAEELGMGHGQVASALRWLHAEGYLWRDDRRIRRNGRPFVGRYWPSDEKWVAGQGDSVSPMSAWQPADDWVQLDLWHAALAGDETLRIWFQPELARNGLDATAVVVLSLLRALAKGGDSSCLSISREDLARRLGLSTSAMKMALTRQRRVGLLAAHDATSPSMIRIADDDSC